MLKPKQCVGLDVSLKEASIAVINENDKLIWRRSVASTPEAIAEALKKHASRAERIGLEAGQFSSWLYHGLRAKGRFVTCIDVPLAYITGIETPARFSRSSAVGAYFGMTPPRYQSGEVDQAGRVSKWGDGMVRGLLYEAAKVLLSRSAKPSDVQVWGHALARCIGKKKATMAVARKLAVILHRMWKTGAPFRWTAVPTPATA
jgi:hypothetical protein